MLKKFCVIDKRRWLVKALIIVSLLAILVRLAIFLLHMHLFQVHLEKSLTNQTQVYITYETKWYCEDSDVDEIDADEIEYTPSEIDMYYLKKENGYDLKYGPLMICDNMLYHNAHWPAPFYSSTGKTMAEVTAEDTIKEYERYFESSTKERGENILRNPTVVTDMLKKYKAFFTIKSVNGNETQYRAHYGKEFFDDMLFESEKKFINPMKYPVIIRFVGDKLKSVSFKIETFTPGERVFPSNDPDSRKSGITDCNVYYDYETTFTAPDTQDYMLATYQNCEPQQILQLPIYSSIIQYDDGKLYVLSDKDENNRCALLIYDLKAKSVYKKILLPQYNSTIWGIRVHEKNIYLETYENGATKMLCCNEETEEITLYNVSTTIAALYFVEDEMIAVTHQDGIYCGKDLNCLKKTDKYNGYAFRYDAKNKKMYAEIEIANKRYLVKVTKDGYSENKVELTGTSLIYDYILNQGNIVRVEYERDEKHKVIKSKFTHYNSNLEKVKETEVNFQGGYLGETDEYIFYTDFLFDKKAGKYYGITPRILRYTIFDGVLYYEKDERVYSIDVLQLKNNYISPYNI